MKRFARLAVVLVAVLAAIPTVPGCGGKTEPTPQKKEEMRQKMIKDAERERREG